MTWDTSDTTALLGGSAAARVSATVSYEDGGKTLVLDVTSDFAPSDVLTVSGLSFANFIAVSAPDSLGLEVRNDGYLQATDDKTITIADIDISSAADQIFAVNDPATARELNPMPISRCHKRAGPSSPQRGDHLLPRAIPSCCGPSQFGQAPGDICLADSCRTDHDDILRCDFLAQIRFDLLTTPAVAQGDGDRPLGTVVANDKAVELRNDLPRGKIVHGRVSTMILSLV